ncbi:Mitochondrial import receptor subunit TOM5 [Hibiscus syriacus]|uniref:Ninja-family protein n=1 Tax=Hibiscus syriacus TaxID=106335 RepID=A0A6A2YX56_HIBSY|nr:Mitochondrial import receptor subunit TOM5 [Hibiscus syriacus]
MAEAKVIDDKVEQQPIQFFPGFSFEKRVSKQTQDSFPEANLNLRLSLGGIYGTGYTKQNPLTRSSSIAGEVVKRNFIDQAGDTTPKSYLPMPRSCSLPVQVERSRRVVSVKELRLMKRAEAKKRAEEKHRNAMKGTDKERFLTAATAAPCFPAGVPAWAAAKNPAFNRAIDTTKKGFGNSEGVGAASSSNLIKSELGITSGAANFVKLELKETESENTTKKAKLSNSWIQDEGMEVMKAMPTVSTTCLDGRKIQGFLYKYTKEQVIIVCVCHGHFLSPEEFVKHAGGRDVENPIKHIKVCTTSFY